MSNLYEMEALEAQHDSAKDVYRYDVLDDPKSLPSAAHLTLRMQGVSPNNNLQRT